MIFCLVKGKYVLSFIFIFLQLLGGSTKWKQYLDIVDILMTLWPPSTDILNWWIFYTHLALSEHYFLEQFHAK